MTRRPTPGDKRQARDALLALFREGEGWDLDKLASALAQLDPTPGDKRQARDELLNLLTGQTADVVVAMVVAAELTRFDATPDDMRQARDALHGLLDRETGGGEAAALIRGLAELNPTVHDLSSWRAWATVPTIHTASGPQSALLELLAAVRLNSALDEWLTVLPSLSPLSS